MTSRPKLFKTIGRFATSRVAVAGALSPALDEITLVVLTAGPSCEAVTAMSTRMDGGVRDIARAIERQVTDGLIEARADGAKSVRLQADGEKVRVDAIATAGEASEPVVEAAASGS